MQTQDEMLATNTVVQAIDFDAFVEASNDVFAQTDLTKFSRPFPSTFSDNVVEVQTKTFRAGYDCCGTEYPSEATMQAASDLAERFGLDVQWGECEKGWGDFAFCVKTDVDRQVERELAAGKGN